MTAAEWKKGDLLKRHQEGALRTMEVAAALRLSSRQVRRLAAKYEAEGQKSLVHGNAGRQPGNRLPDEKREQVLALLRGRYAGFNDTHFVEAIAEREGVSVSRATLQRIARDAGISAAKPRRSRKYRKRREREAQAGALLLWDGSRHDWLEGRGPVLCLMGAIDDATGELMPGAHFAEQETAAGYLRVLAAVVAQKGIPLRLYMDRHGSLKRNDSHTSLAEELEGEQRPTQVGVALGEFGVESIYALSPQAKGRIERLWATLQDRLVSELRLAGASTIESANEVLGKQLPRHNARFGKVARDATTAWRRVPPGMKVEEVCAFRYEASVGNDNVVTVGRVSLQIPRPVGDRSYAKARVEVLQLMSGEWRVKYGGRCIASQMMNVATVEVKPRKARRMNKVGRAFREQVMLLESPERPRARQKAGSRAGRQKPQRPWNSWTSNEKKRAAKASAKLRGQRPASW